ncbi:hypothetical protein J437_LFUL004262 [Ladona fulva]|uniref:Enolase-phosphatase E1 n=1 Tax=Ladona fulva TaxID=123851 RepID=A0A8K0KDB9_LADFU|nr:hypothetical protein J437_LFUL004262 [Ladona fulva]
MAENAATVADIAKLFNKIKCIISDVEGTTTSLAFVRNTLKSYFLDNLHEHLTKNWDDSELQDILLKTKFETDSSDSISNIEDACSFIIRLSDTEPITYSFRQLQARIWSEGYSSGELKGHLFPDVVPAFKRWSQDGKRIFLYSSGLELSQKLLFTNSIAGNVLEIISGCFDTTVGSKYEPNSYDMILKKLECQPGEVIFFSDSIKEVKAASKAGVIAVIMDREGNLPLDQSAKDMFPVVSSFEAMIEHGFYFEY